MFGTGRAALSLGMRSVWRAIHHAPRAAEWLLGFVPMVQFQTHKKDILRSVKAKL